MRRAVAVVLGVGLSAALVPSSASAGVSKTVGSMSLREKVGQLVMFSLGGTHLGSAERDAIKELHLGGVIIFGRNYEDRAQMDKMTHQIQRAAKRGNEAGIGALISVDQEGGVVKRFPDMPPHYSAPQLGEMNDRALTRSQGRKTARALRSAGVNMDLAPVADLDLGPDHVMASRAFGRKPKRTGRLVREFAGGLEDRRVAATLKHFPGLGGATANTDDGKAYVHRSRWELRHIDSVPFELSIEAGVRAVMLSHAMYLNDGGKKPASLNRSIVMGRLRRDLGFRGVAISDALEMIAWRFNGDHSKACPRTVAAGVDIALLAGGIEAAKACARRIYLAVRAGDLAKSRIDKAVTRVLRLKKWARVFEP